LASLRPVTLRKVVKALSALSSSSGMSLDEFSGVLEVSQSHAREVLRFLQSLGLVEVKDDRYVLSADGVQFLKSFDEGDAEFIHKVLSRNYVYRAVYECYAKGSRKASEVVKCANVSMVTADIALRLIREVESLKSSREEKDSETCDNGFLSEFEKALVEVYTELVNMKRSRYTPLSEVVPRIVAKLGITVERFEHLLSDLVKRRRGQIVLVSAPSLARHEYVKIDGKLYTHIMISW